MFAVAHRRAVRTSCGVDTRRGYVRGFVPGRAGRTVRGTRAFVRLYGNIRDAGHQRRYALFARQGLFQGTVERGGHGELRT